MSTLRVKLEELANAQCTGADEYQDCTIHSGKAQAMAQALLDVWDEGEGRFMPTTTLEAALDRADEIK